MRPKKAKERIYLNGKFEPQTIAHHVGRYKFVLEMVPPVSGDLALDICCGSGYGTDMLAKAGYLVSGIDKDIPAIKFARKNYAGSFNRADMTKVTKSFCYTAGYSMPRFDLVTMFEALEHFRFNEGRAILGYVYTLLKDNGYFVVSVPRDINRKNNGFHKSKYTLKLLQETLESVFGKGRVTMFGQDWDTATIDQKDIEKNDFYVAVCRK